MANKPAKDSGLKAKEYEAQFFQQTSGSLTDEVYNIMYDYGHDSIRLAFEFLTDKYSNLNREIIKAPSEILKSELESEMEDLSDKLEESLSDKIMRIPKNVLLPEDVFHADESSSIADENQVDKELSNLKRQLHEEGNTYQILRSEQKNLRKLLKELEKSSQIYTQLDHLKNDEFLRQVKDATSNMENLNMVLKI